MRTIRVHVDHPLAGEAETTLPAGPAHHLLRVLRLRPGARIRLFDDSGWEYPAEILASERRDQCRVRLRPPVQPQVESALYITLIQAVCRGDRMDWCIQKATELGVGRIMPVLSERTEVRLDGARAEKRRLHWQQVAIAAAEQSGRLIAPPVSLPVPIETVSPGHGLALVLDPDADRSIAELAEPATDRCTVVIGPEGGLTESERQRLEDQGLHRVRMGPRILRTETAGPIAIALLQARCGDLA